MEVLKLKGVSKSFRGRPVVRNLSFSVRENRIFGFIGQNGAGKTTTMKMILGLLKPEKGEILVCGEPVRFGQTRTNRHIGYLPDVPEFYGFMTPREYLTFCGRIAGISSESTRKRTDALLEMVGLTEADKRIAGFSRGMKQRLGIAQALLNRPALLLCDEPTSALDPLGRKEILDVLSKVKKHTTIVFSTHILGDVERICDELALLHDGRIALKGNLEEIRGMRKGTSVEIDFFRREDALHFRRYFPGSVPLSSARLRLDKRSEADMTEIMEFLTYHGITPQRLEMLEPTLEDLFMEVVQK